MFIPNLTSFVMKKILLFVSIISCTYNVDAQQCDSNLPISEDFSNTTVINTCWNFIDSDGDGRNWYVADLGGNNGLVSESYRDDAGVLYPNNWAITQVIDLRSYSPSSTIQLNWRVRVSDWSFDQERYSVYASTSNDVSTIALSPVTVFENLDGTGGNWVDRSLDISALAGELVYVAFRHYASVFQDAIHVDDMVISSTLGADDFDISSFKHYYNTSTDDLTLKSNVTFDSVKIYNILGQQVLNKKLTQSEELINLSNITDGIYIAKVEIDNAFQTIKFLKQ
jgi:hypothetical protein